MAVNPADFADTLSGLSDKLDYISECKADTLYLTDLFQATSNCSLCIIPEIGTSEDLYTLAANCRKAGIRLALEIPLSLSVDDPQSGARVCSRLRLISMQCFFRSWNLQMKVLLYSAWCPSDDAGRKSLEASLSATYDQNGV